VKVEDLRLIAKFRQLSSDQRNYVIDELRVIDRRLREGQKPLYRNLKITGTRKRK
jgi:hypothetical protein